MRESAARPTSINGVPLAKVTRPRLPAIVARPHALALLREARKARIIFVSGSAGQGKTTLVLSWLKQRRRPTVWVHLDPADRDPIAFLNVLGAAFVIAFPRAGLTIPPIPAAVPFDPGTFAATFVGSLAAQIAKPFMIVLDDLHELEEHEAISPVLDAVATALPSGSRVVGISRMRLPKAWARWEASDDVFCLPDAVLPFSAEEVRILYRDLFRVLLSEEDAQSLHRATAGWAVALGLLKPAVLTSGVRAALAGTQWAVTGGQVGEYIAQEIFWRLDRPVRELMMTTAVVDSFSLEYVRRVDQGPGAEAWLRAIQDQILVTEISTLAGMRFRYHPMMREFLQAKVNALSDVERLAVLDRVDAALTQDGDLAQAIEVCVRHRRLDRAVSLIQQIGLGTAFSGQRKTLRRWLEAIPAAMREHDPWLSVLYGRAVEFEDPIEADTSYRTALAGFQMADEVDGQLTALAALILTHVYLGRDYRIIVQYGDTARRLLRSRRGSPVARATALCALAFVDLMGIGRVQNSVRKLLWVAAWAERQGVTALALTALSHALLPLDYAADVDRARDVIARGETLCANATVDPGLRAYFLLYRGIHETLQGDHERALVTLSEAEGLCVINGLTSIQANVQLQIARARILRGKRGVLGLVDLVKERTVASGDRFFSSYTSYLHGLAAVFEDRSEDAICHAQDGIRLTTACHAPLYIGWNLFLLGVAQIEAGRLASAETSLLNTLGIFEAGRAWGLAFWVRLHLARLAAERGDMPLARERLATALRIGRELNMQECEAMRPCAKARVLGLARQWGIEPEYTQRLATRWNVQPTMPLSIRTLGRFEIAVDGKIQDSKAWKRNRPQRLLLAVLAAGGREVSKERVMDWLWPEADGDRAASNFYTTLHRVRKAFTSASPHGGRILQMQGGHVSVDPSLVWSDCCAFEDAVRRARCAEADGRCEAFQQSLREARDLYQGEFLSVLSDEPWIVKRRNDLRREFTWVQAQFDEGNTPRPL